MNNFFTRILSAIASDALALAPADRVPNILKVVHESTDLSTLSAKQRQQIADEIIANLPKTPTTTRKPAAKKAAKPKGKK